ncbi:Hypothetical predicted protein [Cloeon dipterum]|uniref:E3 SUMO-protein ligase NSE2 n=1 Tax=Cloeon dipterum TaxID=197152 RepID=A0A8S1BYY5_9INSE|nr:Hypothetical predicted protein [Cloeon dipterum]
METLQDVVDESLQKFLSHLSRVTNKLDLSGLTDEEKEVFLEKCQSVIGDSCVMDMRHKRHKQLLKRTETLFADPENTKTPHEIFEELKKEDDAEEIDFESHDLYQNIKEIVKDTRTKIGLGNKDQSSSQNEEDGLLMSDVHISTTCPISKQAMTDPYKSQKCGHTFDKNSIDSLMRLRPYIRCPIGGCGHHVSKADLVVDYQMRRHIESTTDM